MTAAPHPELDARFRAEVRTSTRATGIVAGAVGVVALPAWMGFDYIVEPDHASTFALLRLIALGPMLVCLGALFTGFGRRRPELLVLAILAAVEIAIAFMIPRVETQHAAYALGMSIGIYATAFLLVWPPRYTAAAIGITWTAWRRLCSRRRRLWTRPGSPRSRSTSPPRRSSPTSDRPTGSGSRAASSRPERHSSTSRRAASSC